MAVGLRADGAGNLTDSNRVVEGTAPLLQTMLRHGADINARLQYGATVLHWDALWQRLHIAEWLIRHGANVNAQADNGSTPLMMAAIHNHTALAGLLLTHGARLNVQDSDGNTALHNAVMSDADRSLIRDLLAHGANPDLPDKSGFTSIKIAQTRNRPDIVRRLKRH